LKTDQRAVLAPAAEKQFNHTMSPATAKMPDKRGRASRRGECPTLARPMLTGDGLLARLRPIDNVLTLSQLRQLAEAAARFGNGIVEITARGSLQVRGLRPETVAAFERAALASGIDISTGVGIETPPLAGLDAEELINVRPIAEELRSRIAEHVPPLILAPKLAITVDGGGRFHLGSVMADVKVSAFLDGQTVRFLVAVATRAVAIVDESQLVGVVISLLEKLSAIGPTTRGKDLDLPTIEAPLLDQFRSPLLGLHRAADSENNASILGIAFAYRQADSASLIAFANAAESAGAGEFRLAPDHGLLITDLTFDAAQHLQQIAATFGFLTEPNDPRRHIALCAGSRGCASAFYDTGALAAKILANAPDLLDGSFDIHLSGCAKGCAYPASSLIAFVGARAGYGLVVNGAASGMPFAYIGENHIDTALARLQALLRQSKEDSESVSACLTRLGAEAIVSALQLDRT
jgi:precorrin-3B synthase